MRIGAVAYCPRRGGGQGHPGATLTKVSAARNRPNDTTRKCEECIDFSLSDYLVAKQP